MEKNIDLHLQKEESIAGPTKELIEVQVEPNELSRVFKIDKGLGSEVA